MNRIFITLLTLLISLSSLAQEPMKASETRYDWSNLAESITQGKTSNYDKAYAIYRWLCDNIAYDTSYSIHDADTAYEQKKGVCQAYSELFFRLGEAVGLKVDIISGKSKDDKGVISDDGHAWVFVYTNGNSGILVDPTWGAGSVDGNKFTRKENDDTWFHVDPEWMLFTHFPDIDSYQLIDNKIDYETFASLPPLYPNLKKFGFKAEEMLAASLAGRKHDLPECYENSNINVAKMPLEGTLRVGTEYDFAVEPKVDYEFAIINGEDYDKDWQRSSGYHLIRFVPGNAEEVNVTYRNRGSNDKWKTLVTYKVAQPTAADIARLEKIAPHKSPVFKALTNFDSERFIKRGINFEELLAAVKRENIKQVPKIYDSGDFTLNDVPLNGKLKVGQTYQFAFSPYEKGEWVIINGDDFMSDWKSDPQTGAWVMTVTPQFKGKLLLGLCKSGNKYSYCVEYDVE